MKKLTTLFILAFLAIGLFAEPKVPKYFSGDSEFKEDAFKYVSNDLMYYYEVQAGNIDTPRFKYRLKISKSSLVFDTEMVLIIFFETEKQLDNFTKTIHLSDIENEFNRLRKEIIMIDEQPNPTNPKFKDEYFSYEKRPKYIFYEADGTKLK